jgi:nucleotide-binding universal stress UspA family protein
MSDPDPLSGAKLASIFHPSDFSEASDIAFAHALRIALVTGARLDLLHVSSSGKSDWLDFPAVRATLERWRLLPNGSSMGDLAKLGIDVNTIVIPGQNPIAASLDFLETHPADLIVLAVHQYEGRTRWMKQRVGEPIARGAGEMTLFIPQGARGFVASDDGAVSLRNVLIPIEAGTFYLLHAGDAAEVPVVGCRCPPGWAVTRLARPGDPAEVIVSTAESIAADLIAMTTEGPQGFLDALRGSTSERVLRRTPCPVMSLPADQWLSRMRRFWIN